MFCANCLAVHSWYTLLPIFQLLRDALHHSGQPLVARPTVYVHRQIECRVTGEGLRLFRTGVALEHEVDIGNTDRVKVDFALACPLLDTGCFEISVYGPCSMRWDTKERIGRIGSAGVLTAIEALL